MSTRLPRLMTATGPVLAALLALVSLGSTAHAQAPTAAELPAVLRPWMSWVLADQPLYGCTPRESASGADASVADPVCVWPGALTITVGAEGGTFSLDATLDRRFPLVLPGSGMHWPMEVRIDGVSAPVLASSEQPTVWVSPGSHRIEGRIAWAAMPDTLAVPPAVARVVVVRQGVATPARRGTSGEVWLRATDAETSEAEEVSLEVHRRLADGSPVELTTSIHIRAAGRARELRLGNVLPAGAVPVEVSADLPVRLQATGALTLQLHAGTFTVEIRALVAGPETPFRRPALDAPWPPQEIWVWAADESFRQVQVEGATGIDPQRTSLPEAWRAYSAYVVGADTQLSLRTIRRGEPTPPPNELQLRRSVWLDLDGTGFTAQDQLELTMHSVHRVELAEGALGRVSMGSVDQLITVADEGGRPGVEVRAVRGSILAEWRQDGPVSTLPAVGWSEDAQSSTTVLNLPPGWTLLHAGGVDHAPGTWLRRWSLLGFFALLLITAAVFRVYGAAWGALAFVGVGLGFHEESAPQWVWFVLAALLALHRALGGRRFERVVRLAYGVAFVAAVGLTVWFAADRFKVAYHPTLANPDAAGIASTGFSLTSRAESVPVAVAPGAPAAAEALEEGGSGSFARGQAYASAASDSDEAGRYDASWVDPTAIVQTGFGVPTWTWSQSTLAFEGPVANGHRIALYLAPPWLTRTLAALQGLLALALLAMSLRMRPRGPTAPAAGGAPADAPGEGASPAAALAVALALALAAGPAHAQEGPAASSSGAIPSTELLGQLRQRLLLPPVCGDHCSEAGAARVEVLGDRMSIELDVHASAASAYPLPGPSDTWVPDTVSLDGVDGPALVRLESGFLHVRVPQGAHTVRIVGTVSGRDAVTLAFGRAPRTLAVAARDWEVDGLGGEGHVSESIRLRRRLTVDAGGGASETSADLPAWLEIERRLDVGVRWTLRTTVRRRSPSNAPTVARIPLLEGESVTDSAVAIEDGHAVVTLGAGESERAWGSVLDPRPTVLFRAPADGRLSEVWSLACSPLWHCESEGLAPTTTAAAGVWEPRFHPWPGEALTVSLRRPSAAEGSTATVDRASLTVRPGTRLTMVTLDLGVRTSTSSPLSITLPEGAAVRSLTVDGVARALQREGAAVAVALQPGAHAIVLEWQEPRGWGLSYATPAVSLGSSSVNLELRVEGGADRWILWVDGPPWGPVVRFWSSLLLVIGLAVALARRRGLPLRFHDWALLLVGLTQVHPVAALCIVGWFFLLEHRRTTPVASPFVFDVRQLLVVGATFVAFALLIWAVEAGLLGDPEMGIEGAGSTRESLRFFVDRSTGALPEAVVFSTPVFVFRVLMFAWSLWLALAMLRWARWGWGAFRQDGLLRALHTPRPSSPPAVAIEPPVEPPSAEPGPHD